MVYNWGAQLQHESHEIRGPTSSCCHNTGLRRCLLFMEHVLFCSSWGMKRNNYLQEKPLFGTVQQLLRDNPDKVSAMDLRTVQFFSPCYCWPGRSHLWHSGRPAYGGTGIAAVATAAAAREGPAAVEGSLAASSWPVAWHFTSFPPNLNQF